MALFVSAFVPLLLIGVLGVFNVLSEDGNLENAIGIALTAVFVVPKVQQDGSDAIDTAAVFCFLFGLILTSFPAKITYKYDAYDDEEEEQDISLLQNIVGFAGMLFLGLTIFIVFLNYLSYLRFKWNLRARQYTKFCTNGQDVRLAFCEGMRYNRLSKLAFTNSERNNKINSHRYVPPVRKLERQKDGLDDWDIDDQIKNIWYQREPETADGPPVLELGPTHESGRKDPAIKPEGKAGAGKAVTHTFTASTKVSSNTWAVATQNILGDIANPFEFAQAKPSWLRAYIDTRNALAEIKIGDVINAIPRDFWPSLVQRITHCHMLKNEKNNLKDNSAVSTIYFDTRKVAQRASEAVKHNKRMDHQWRAHEKSIGEFVETVRTACHAKTPVPFEGA